MENKKEIIEKLVEYSKYSLSELSETYLMVNTDGEITIGSRNDDYEYIFNLPLLFTNNDISDIYYSLMVELSRIEMVINTVLYYEFKLNESKKILDGNNRNDTMKVEKNKK